MPRQPVRTSLCRKEENPISSSWDGAFVVTTKGRIQPQLTRYQLLVLFVGTQQRCQHFLEIDRRPWVAKTTSIGARVWKDVIDAKGMLP